MGSDSKPWVDGPYKLIEPSVMGDDVHKRATGSARLAAEMALVHNSFIRGINAVYLQCINVGKRGTPKDQLDFANFASQWVKFIGEHHKMEETDIFPGINEVCGVPGFMDASVEEHEAFHDGLETYEAYLGSVIDGKEKYSGEKLKGIIDGFMPALELHLSNELQTLLRLSEFEDKVDWPKWFEEVVAVHAKRMLDDPKYKSTIVPLAFVLHEKDFGNGVWAHFPPVSWFVHLLIRWMYVPTHQDWWRFAGCDPKSNRKELPFA